MRRKQRVRISTINGLWNAKPELPPEVVRAEVESFLASVPAAWDPNLVSR
jgi:hypothetical protein